MSIPDAAIEAAAVALQADTYRRANVPNPAPLVAPIYLRERARAAIEAAMPAIREAIAREIEAEGSVEPDHRDSKMFDRGIRYAARIVRGGTQ